MASNSQSILLLILGQRVTYPEVRLQPTVQRASPVANVGWKHRRRCTITNTGADPISNYPYAIDLGVTTALVAAKAQADADDVRVWHNGREVRRTLTDWNSATATLVWIVIPYLGAGESLTWDVMYGNSAAVAAGIPALTLLDDLPAFDIQTAGANRSTNVKWIYAVDRTVGNAGKGGWPLSTGIAQPEHTFAAPGAWQPVNTKHSDDDRWQESYSTYVATGTKYQGRFEARRGRPGSLVVTRDAGVDGVMLRNPLGMSSVRADIRWTNHEIGEAGSDPLGQVVILTRNTPDEEWKPLYSNAALQAIEAVIATATYTPAAAVKEIAFAVWPFAGDNVDAAARPDRYVNAAWNSVLEIVPVASVLTQSLAAEEEVYELATILRYGGGGEAAPVPPYHSIALGNAAQASGKDTPRLAVALSQQVKIKTEQRAIEVWNSGLTAKIEDAPLPSYRAVDGTQDASGTAVEQVAHEWLPMIPAVAPITNDSFEMDLTGWAQDDVANVTEVSSRDTVVKDSGAASHKVVLSASTVGSGAVTARWYESEFLPVGGRDAIQVSAAFRVSAATLHPRLFLNWYDSAQALLSQSLAVDWTPVITLWPRRAFQARVPSGAVYYRFGYEVWNGAANATGDVYDDTWAVDDTELILIDVASGTLVVGATWTDQHALG